MTSHTLTLDMATVSAPALDGAAVLVPGPAAETGLGASPWSWALRHLLIDIHPKPDRARLFPLGRAS